MGIHLICSPRILFSVYLLHGIPSPLSQYIKKNFFFQLIFFFFPLVVWPWSHLSAPLQAWFSLTSYTSYNLTADFCVLYVAVVVWMNPADVREKILEISEKIQKIQIRDFSEKIHMGKSGGFWEWSCKYGWDIVMWTIFILATTESNILNLGYMGMALYSLWKGLSKFFVRKKFFFFFFRTRICSATKTRFENSQNLQFYYYFSPIYQSKPIYSRFGIKF